MKSLNLRMEKIMMKLQLTVGKKLALKPELALNAMTKVKSQQMSSVWMRMKTLLDATTAIERIKVKK